MRAHSGLLLTRRSMHTDIQRSTRPRQRDPRAATTRHFAAESTQWRHRRSPQQGRDSRNARRKRHQEALPFMPEMLQHAGKRFRVSKRADKGCDTIGKSGSRRMYNAVHLENVRCDGSAHGGCEAACLIYWKEAWLKRVPDRPGTEPAPQPLHASFSSRSTVPDSSVTGPCTEEALCKATRRVGDQAAGSVELFSCQATEFRHATSPSRGGTLASTSGTSRPATSACRNWPAERRSPC